MSPAPKTAESVRLQVVLARCGFGSRRSCEEFIEAGRVSVNGTVVTAPGKKVNLHEDKVLVDDEAIRPERPAYYMVNKPKGMLCTNRDPSGRPRVIDLFPKKAGRVFPIGRLDENTVGLILVTNDGEMSHLLAHPKFRVPKVYQVQVAGNPTQETLKQLRQGLYFSDGRFKVERVKRVGRRGKSTILEVMIKEGRNREIRRLFARIGHKVMKLERTAFGPLQLRSVPVGRARPLTREEIKLLRDYVDNWQERQQEDGQKNSLKGKKGSSKRRSGNQKKTTSRSTSVEVGPVGVSERDLTGRLRKPPHPAVEKTSRSRKRSAR